MTLIAVCEGETDLPVARKVLATADFQPSTLFATGGKSSLDHKLDGYNQAARGSPWLVLRDLDLDDEVACPGEFLRRRRFEPALWMCFRLAVRSVEDWLLADDEAFSDFFGVSRRLIPAEPELEIAPKKLVVTLATRSKKREVRDGMTPRVDSSRTVGALYSTLIKEFAQSHWSPERASHRSPSLKRALIAVSVLKSRWEAHARGRR